MANRSKRRAQRRLQIITAIFAILVILSMVVSLLWSFSPPTPPVSSDQPQPTVIVVTPAP
jgi:regulatory protein YycH of two-component signal transduction system YycFG